jgi:ketosteroid isomerase-like protein
MSRENVELVRGLYEGGVLDAAIDGSGETLRELLHPDVVFVNPPEAVEPGTRRGIDEVMGAAAGAARSFGATRHELRELFDAGDAVVALVTAEARGRDSGVQVSQEEAHTWTLRDGKVVAFEWSRDPPAALAAAGVDLAGPEG